MAASIALKLSRGNETRVLSLPVQPVPAWGDMAASIAERFQLDSAPSAVTYLDGEGDQITVSSDVELQDMWQSFAGKSSASVGVMAPSTETEHSHGRSPEVEKLLDSLRAALAEDPSLAFDVHGLLHGSPLPPPGPPPRGHHGWHRGHRGGHRGGSRGGRGGGPGGFFGHGRRGPPEFGGHGSLPPFPAFPSPPPFGDHMHAHGPPPFGTHPHPGFMPLPPPSGHRHRHGHHRHRDEGNTSDSSDSSESSASEGKRRHRGPPRRHRHRSLSHEREPARRSRARASPY